MSVPRMTSTIAGMLLLASPLAYGQPSDATGHWEGAIKAPGRDVAIVVDLGRNARGELVATFGNPAEHLTGYPLSDITIDGQSIRFVLSAGSGGGPFAGILSADGKSISGEFSATTPKGPVAVPFTLARNGEANVQLPRPSARIGQEMEGTWGAAIELEGRSVRVTLKLSNQPDGTSTGIIATDASAIDIPITSIAQSGSALTLDVSIVGGRFSGVLSADRTELAGTWTQASFEGRLTFKRSAPQGPK